MTTPQQDLLFKAAFLPGDRGLAAWQAWRAWVDLDDFLDPGSYRLLPQLYRNLKKLGVDDPLMLKLKGVTRLHWSKNQLILHQLEEINGLLRQAGIWPIVLGRVGLALSGQLDTPLNPLYYYDLLVRREEAIATVGCLQKMGMRPVDGWRVPSEVRGYERQGSCLFHDMQGSRVHLFWGPYGQQVGLEYWETGVWERARIFEWNGNAFHVLGLEDQILYIAWQNIARDGSTSFLQAIDIMLVLNTHGEKLDGTKLRNLAKGFGLTLPLQHTLGYIWYTLGDNWLPAGSKTILEWPNSAKERLAYQLNFHRIISWEDFPSEWWGYLRENSTAPRLKKFAGFARLMRRKWQWKYIWQVPILGMTWVGRKVLYRTDGSTGGTYEIVRAEMEPPKQQNKDWNSIREKLSPVLKEKINKQLSPSVKEKIKKQYEQLQDKRIKESLAIIDVFNKNSINYVVLKGLTLQFFDKNRFFFDLDIFVPQTDFKKAEALLGSLGYLPEECDLKNYRDTSSKHIAYNKPDRIQVELHYRLFANSSIDENVLPLIKEKCYLEVSGISVPSLSPELMLLEVFLHNFYNHRFTEYDKKWYNDIETVIINQNVDWNKFLDFSRKTGCCELIYKILSFLEGFNGKKSAMPGMVRQELLNNSSAIRLLLTHSFDNQLFNDYKEIRKIMVPEKIAQDKFLLDSKIKSSLIFSLGFKKEFFNSKYDYIIAYKEFYLAPVFFIKETFKRRSFGESARKIKDAFRSLKKERYKQRG